MAAPNLSPILDMLSWAGILFYALAFISLMMGAIQKSGANQKGLNRWLHRQYDSWNTPFYKAIPTLFREGVRFYQSATGIVALIALIMGMAGIFFLNSFVSSAYAAAGIPERFAGIASSVSGLKSIIHYSIAILFGSIVVANIIGAAYLRKEAGRIGKQATERLELILQVGFVIGALLPSVYGLTFFLRDAYLTIISDVASASSAIGLIKAQILILPLHVYALGFAAYIGAVFIVAVIPAIKRIEFIDYAVELLTKLQYDLRQDADAGKITASNFSQADLEALREDQLNRAYRVSFSRAVSRIQGGFVSGISISYLITVLAAYIGRNFSPGAELSLTGQLLMWNAVFDGLTVIATLYALRWAIQGNTVIRIFPATAIDLSAAALFAVLSLYLGLLGSSNSLEFSDGLLVLVGQYDEYGSYYGPLFWVMHSAFLPTILVWCAFVLLGVAAYAIASYLLKPILKSINKNEMGVYAAIAAQFFTAGVFFSSLGEGRGIDIPLIPGI